MCGYRYILPATYVYESKLYYKATKPREKLYYNTKSMEVNMIKTARKYKKMTLMDVSSATGISKGTLSRIESGKIDVRLSTLNRICSAIGVKVVISL